MFQLVAVLFMVVNGVQSDKPFHTLPNKIPFSTKEECLNYLETDRGKASKQFIESWAAAQNSQAIVKFDCIQIVSKGEEL